MDSVISLLIYLLAVSTTNEHAIQVLKPLIKRWCAEPPAAIYYLLSAAFGTLIVWLCPPAAIDKLLTIRYPLVSTFVVGVATAGGSSVWHELLSILTDLRAGIKKSDSETKG